MLIEGLVGVVSLIAATAMFPGDYFAINTAPATFATLGIPVVNLPQLEAAVGESVAGRPGGAVSLAVGIAQIFSGLPGMRGLMDYWYHFAIMFEALFILTTIDTGTRVARFLVQEFLGRFYAPMGRQEWMPGAIFSTLLVVCAVGVLHLDRQHRHDLADVRHRQPVACRGRAGGRDDDRHQYRQGALRVGDACCRSSFVSVTTLTAGVLSVRDNFWPMAIGPNARAAFPGLPEHEPHRDHDGVRARDPRQRDLEMDPGAQRPSPACAGAASAAEPLLLLTHRVLQLPGSDAWEIQKCSRGCTGRQSSRTRGGHHDRRQRSRRRYGRFGGERRRGDRRRQTLRTVLFAAAAMSAAPSAMIRHTTARSPI